MSLAKVEITGSGNNTKVIIDGHDISRLLGEVSASIKAGNPASVILTIPAAVISIKTDARLLKIIEEAEELP